MLSCIVIIYITDPYTHINTRIYQLTTPRIHASICAYTFSWWNTVSWDVIHSFIYVTNIAHQNYCHCMCTKPDRFRGMYFSAFIIQKFRTVRVRRVWEDINKSPNLQSTCLVIAHCYHLNNWQEIIFGSPWTLNNQMFNKRPQVICFLNFSKIIQLNLPKTPHKTQYE